LAILFMWSYNCSLQRKYAEGELVRIDLWPGVKILFQ
jgi:hypothetical protein